MRGPFVRCFQTAGKPDIATIPGDIIQMEGKQEIPQRGGDARDDKQK